MSTYSLFMQGIMLILISGKMGMAARPPLRFKEGPQNTIKKLVNWGDILDPLLSRNHVFEIFRLKSPPY